MFDDVNFTTDIDNNKNLNFSILTFAECYCRLDTLSSAKKKKAFVSLGVFILIIALLLI